MRQLCNVAYVACIETMDPDAREDFDLMLEGKPPRGPKSQGTEGLMAAMSMRQG